MASDASNSVARSATIEKIGRTTAMGGAALLTAYAVYLVAGPDGEPWATIFKKGVLDVVLLSAVAACFLCAAVRPRDRWIWIAFGVGALMETFGIFYHQFVLAWDTTPPYPSPQDAFYLLVYPGWYAGLLMLVRRQLHDGRASLWLHGVIGGLTIAALAAALVFNQIVSTSGDNAAAVATNLAYPVADTMLVALLVCILALNGLRAGRKWNLIFLGITVFYVADVKFALDIAGGTFAPGTLLDVGWPAGMLLIASAGYVRSREPRKFHNEDRWMLLPSLVFAGLALGIIVYGWARDVHPAAIWLAAGALVVLMVQFALATLENSRLLGVSRREAKVDEVTNLPNRRRLTEDLEQACATATTADPVIVMLFDLNGFKAYNDRFGHLAGDALLKRLGSRLRDSMSEVGDVYRLGGDEFCLVVRAPAERVDQLTITALDALVEHGEGFKTSSSCGVALVPNDATDPVSAIRAADQRMYAQKHEDGSLDSRHFDTVIRVIQRFAPMIDTHRTELVPIVLETARAMGMSESDVKAAVSAFEVCDVGYYAVPEGILRKPGPLTDTEWALMRTHPVVGERLLMISPTLSGVGKLVRASHERVDGAGYPDGLSGDQIPLGAQIVAAATAFDAMISHRPHRTSMTVDQAIAEIKCNAGTQFDESIVEEFCKFATGFSFEVHAEINGRENAAAQAN